MPELVPIEDSLVQESVSPTRKSNPKKRSRKSMSNSSMTCAQLKELILQYRSASQEEAPTMQEKIENALDELFSSKHNLNTTSSKNEQSQLADKELVQGNVESQENEEYSQYIKLAHSWNALPLQPYRIATLVWADKMFAVVERKSLEGNPELKDWFDDQRIGAVVRGEKVLGEGEFWVSLLKNCISGLQQHFEELPVRVMDSIPQGKNKIVWGQKPHKTIHHVGPAAHQSGVEKTHNRKFPRKNTPRRH